ncbi:MAG: hypothetical protein BWX86_02614 [Verrucomicrobia bacterium ADurb.Bin122]|jgi:hypothetical protein|nr:MAG: hypothetical protein BWX86_02614 [Verrucomicrobia bacterium ADurb.Bin122]HOD47598.1 hypothetical protein [Opitutaceae bacterium]HQL21611.1 hypothetical protein [Opitutaceae bacterium]
MMPRAVFFLLAATVAVSASGCMFWKKKNKPAKPSYAVSELETSFKARWIEKRAADLVASGTNAAEATRMATEEFDGKFAYTKAAGAKHAD